MTENAVSIRWVSNKGMIRVATVAGFLVLVMIGHWWTPTDSHSWHAIHLTLRKFFFVPVVLAAVWFNLRGALVMASAVTLVYVPHVFLQWADQPAENMNQFGEILTVWLIAALAGVLVGFEKKALRNLAKANEGALIAMVNALDAREHDTQLHSLRVRAYAIRLGRELMMNDHQLRVLGQAALLHDVGKIGVPDSVLLKSQPLTDDEWQLMRDHPEVGRRILEPVEFLDEAAEIVHSHHERFDGNGYPRGLAGDDIPFGARVFAVADAFDALMSERPYQKGVGFEETERRILADSNSHFDPRVVEAFSTVAEEEWASIGQAVEQPT